MAQGMLWNVPRFCRRDGKHSASTCAVAEHRTSCSSRSKQGRSLLHKSTIVFCATHDTLLHGKHSYTGAFRGLLYFRVDTEEKALQEHFRSCAENAKWASPRVHDEIIEICGDLLREGMASKANAG